MFSKINSIIMTANVAIRQHFLSTNEWTAEQRRRYAIFQYYLATIWPGHLSGCAGAVSNPVLVEALRENASCEVGSKPGTTGHVTLARQFCLSQGITVAELAEGAYWPEQARNIARMVQVIGESQDFIAGYTFGSETFAAVMFEVFQQAFRATGADMRYMIEHVETDVDEHSRMLHEAILSLVDEGGDLQEIERGVAAAAQSRIEYLEYIQFGAMAT